MIYISTGGEKHISAVEYSLKLIENNIENIELSGGKYRNNMLCGLSELKQCCRFTLHNYFPPPQNPFVFNLASLNKKIRKRSYEHAIQAMDWSVELGSDVYSFHAGFLLDPQISELGKKFGYTELFKKDEALSAFINNVNKLSLEAEKRGISLLIENNVLSKINYLEFNFNPFLMIDSKEARYIMENTANNVNLLIDIAHLKVSSNTVGFDPTQYLQDIRPWIQGYHLSDNNGEADTNSPVNVDSWFWSYIDKNISYMTLEVYNKTTFELKQQVELTRNILGR